MYLKSLTLRGFKSFADPTTLDFEPGVTVVVGPNGSGKSNVVDAVAWVLGAQGPRVLRSARMDDVIFAGTDRRAPLGRAEVSLTIDNSSRRLAIDFNEVTVTRTLFRSGDSEYAINGVACRLLDVQELFSDSGVGRQQHVIVGQGQLDVILAQRPEDRRMVIEEAAGVLKYRRRRERAERRLESSEASLARLSDLLKEVTRQIRPLERQAASAIRHEELTTELRALRLYLAGRELAGLIEKKTTIETDLEVNDAQSAAYRHELATVDAQLTTHQRALVETSTELITAQVVRARQLEERASGLAALIGERRRSQLVLQSVLSETDSIEGAQASLDRVEKELALAEHEADEIEHERSRIQSSNESEDHAVDVLDVEQRKAELVRAQSEQNALNGRHARSQERAEIHEADVAVLVERLTTLRSHEAGQQVALDAARRLSDEAIERTEAAEHAFFQAEQQAHDAEALVHGEIAHVEALELGLDAMRARAGLSRVAELPGVLGTLLEVVDVDEDLLDAFEAAIDSVSDAVIVDGDEHAKAALGRLHEVGGSGLIVALDGSSRLEEVPGDRSSLPPGCVFLRELVRGAHRGVDGLLDELLKRVVLCRSGFEDALEIALFVKDLTIVTLEGDRFSQKGWRVGARSAGATKAALEAAKARLIDAQSLKASTTEAYVTARTVRDELLREKNTRQRDVDRLESELRRAIDARDETTQILAATRAQLEQSLAERQESERLLFVHNALVRSLEDRVRDMEFEASEHASKRTQRQVLVSEIEVRLASVNERQSLLRTRRDELFSTIQARRAEQDQAEKRSSGELAYAGALEGLERAITNVRSRLREVLVMLVAMRDERAKQNAIEGQATRQLRERLDGIERSVQARVEARQHMEIELAEVRVRHEAAMEALVRDHDAVAEEALSAPMPTLAEGVEANQRARELDRELRLLGPVNPLAREELQALTERHVFLEIQLEDVRSARRELHQVIRAVDEEIVSAFASALADVQVHFSALFSVLFPGGTGQISLTTPEDLLNTGVEIEARPAGRNVRRLSLLSGGERSLVALAFLFAVFRSRPSPFYLLDEVEAALDEVNLHRFLGLVEQFRHEAQLLIVSHQKKTMEIADALYGVTMQPGGATRVVSERVVRTTRPVAMER